MHFWIGRNTTVKVVIIPKVIHRFNLIIIKIPENFSKNKQKILKLLSNHMRPGIAKAIPGYERKTEGITLQNRSHHVTKVPS